MKKSGSVAQAVGDAWEKWLEVQHQMALQLGIVAHEVEHNQAQTRVVGGRLIYTAPGVADYTGVLTRGAVTLAVEAKSTQKDYLPRSAVLSKQQAYLNAVAVAGGVALLCVEFRDGNSNGITFKRRYAIPWTLVPWRVKKSAESVSVEDLDSWYIGNGVCYLERFHARGPMQPGAVVQQRVFPRE